MFIPCEDLDFIISLFHDAEITVNIKNIELVRDVVIIEVVIVDVVFTIVATKAKDWEWNLNETKTNTKFSLCTELSVVSVDMLKIGSLAFEFAFAFAFVYACVWCMVFSFVDFLVHVRRNQQPPLIDCQPLYQRPTELMSRVDSVRPTQNNHRTTGVLRCRRGVTNVTGTLPRHLPHKHDQHSNSLK